MVPPFFSRGILAWVITPSLPAGRVCRMGDWASLEAKIFRVAPSSTPVAVRVAYCLRSWTPAVVRARVTEAGSWEGVPDSGA